MIKTKTIVGLCLILALVGLAFAPCLQNNFTNWDDNLYVTGNSVVSALTWANLKKTFTSFFVTHFQPLTILTYSLEHHFFKLDPFFYHLTNLILHLLNTLLVFWLVYLAGGSLAVGGITALFFGIHPLQTETVAWISQRKTLLYACFYLAALISYFYYLRRGLKLRYYFLCLGFFVLALLSKSVAFTLPLVLWLLDYLAIRNEARRVLSEKIPFLALSLIIGLVALWGGYLSTVFYQPAAYSLLARLIGASSDLIFYLYKLCWPLKLSAIYPYLQIQQNPLYWLCLPVAIALFSSLLFAGRKNRKLIFGAGFFLLTIFPAIRFMPLEEALVADHYIYLPAAGILYLLAQGLLWLFKAPVRYRRLIQGLAIFIILSAAIACIFLTRSRCRVWQNSQSLWNDVLKKYPLTATAYNNRGEFFLGQKEFALAALDFKQAIAIRTNAPYNPTYKYYYLNLGNALRASGRLDEAQAVFKMLVQEAEEYFRQPQALRRGDKNKVLSSHRRNIEAGAYFNLGNIQDALGDNQSALALYLKAIELSPRMLYAYEALGDLYAKEANLAAAAAQLAEVIKIDPGYLPGYIKLAEIYRRQGQDGELVLLYRKAVDNGLSFFDAYYYLGNLYVDAKNERAAIPLYRQAIKINPHSPAACLGLGSAYLTVRRNKEAVLWLSWALKLDPGLAVAHHNLALAYYYGGQYDLAIKHCDQAASLGYAINPKLIELLTPHRRQPPLATI